MDLTFGGLQGIYGVNMGEIYDPAAGSINKVGTKTSPGAPGDGTEVQAVTTPTPPKGVTYCIQFDSDAGQDYGWIPFATGGGRALSGTKAAHVVMFYVRRDAGTINGETWVWNSRATSGTDADKKSQCGVLINTSGDLEFYYDGTLQGTVTLADNTWTHIAVFYPGVSTDHQSFTVLKDRTVEINVSVTFTGGGAEWVGENFGSDTKVTGNTMLFFLCHIVHGRTTRDDPIGQMTVKEWALTTPGAPAFDEGTKSSGSDAAPLVDERPPAGDGETDVDDYFVKDAASNRDQTVEVVNTLLATGDKLVAYVLWIWDRSHALTKIINSKAMFYDGTTLQTELLVSLSGVTSYATHDQSGNICPGDLEAPDGNDLQGKANSYLDNMEFGTRAETSSDADAVLRVATLVVEAGIVLSGETISALADPPAAGGLHRRHFPHGVKRGVMTGVR